MSTDTTVNKDVAAKFKDILGPMDPTVDREVRELLITARVGMLLRASFFGNLATRLKLVNADEWCPTAATDGRNFYYNCKFIKMLKPKEVEFLFGHEVLHCVYDHFGRRGDRNHSLFNIAADYCVNADLKKHKVGEFITTVPCLYDVKYTDWSAEQVYDDLYENADKIDLDSLLDQMIDQHLEGGGDESDEGKGPAKYTKEEREQIKQDLKEAMLSAAQTSDAGNIPGGVKRLVQQLTEPKMNWRELLRMQLQSTIKNDYTFTRINRKGWDCDAILPGMNYDEAIDIVIAMDMSGSIGRKQGKDFLSEVKGITEEFSNFKIKIFCFDTEVYNHQEFTSENLDEIDEYDVAGGGGTDFDAIFRYLKDEDIAPKRLVVFTDGYPWNSWGDANYCDTVWIIHGDKNPNPPFGTWALYEED
jgi:predicted metal-dependent peptidase|tara:strand:+ start:542 stop:1792 length:1251 start_codon:yes stop_codon:yes gene_type:complete